MLEPEAVGRDRMDLAEALRALRRASGLSGERLAARTHMSQAKISRIETGDTVPSLLDVERLLRARLFQDHPRLSAGGGYLNA